MMTSGEPIRLSEWPWSLLDLTIESLMNREWWRPVPGTAGCYEVSNYGQVRSVERIVPNGHGATRRVRQRLMKPYRPDGARGFVNIGQRPRPVASLVVGAFVGPRQTGRECCHNDGRSENDRLDNLRWDTHRSNMDDAVAHRAMPFGVRQAASKLDDDGVRNIRRLYQTIPISALAEMFGVSKSTAFKAATKRTWRHVS